MKVQLFLIKKNLFDEVFVKDIVTIYICNDLSSSYLLTFNQILNSYNNGTWDINNRASCVYSARLHSHDSTSELYYSCIKGNYQTKLFSQLTNAAEILYFTPMKTELSKCL
ncbi:hypothetical protein EB796_025263 [Bugula neritina]|uniref:Uncharacterized protein n=1 Tax=Bugula neritina TaxID=10212 RepID=A0A7J7IR44_BUGNE|nr:hypothetical protein EB796_025263 [Bugula neritina]